MKILMFNHSINKLYTNAVFTIVIFLHCYILECSTESTAASDKASDFDVENSVGFGEDCSDEGPYCDIRQHLSCDNVEEICVCDDKNGYVHVGHLEVIPTLFEEEEAEQLRKICMKSSDLEYKMDKLLNVTKKIKDFTDIMRKYQKYLPKKYQDLLKDEL